MNVGLTLGQPLGLNVGLAPGETDLEGRDEGFFVGLLVGRFVGFKVGLLVGLWVGFSVGFKVGGSVGSRVGGAVGAGVGGENSSKWNVSRIAIFSNQSGVCLDLHEQIELVGSANIYNNLLRNLSTLANWKWVYRTLADKIRNITVKGPFHKSYIHGMLAVVLNRVRVGQLLQAVFSSAIKLVAYLSIRR
jgi:hypothetical protein